MTAGLLAALARRDDVDVHAYALTWRGRDALAATRAARHPGVDPPDPGTGRAGVLGTRAGAAPRPRTGPVRSTSCTPPTSSRRRRARRSWSPCTTSRSCGTPSCAPPTRSAIPRLMRRAIARGAVVHTPSEFVAAEVRELLDAPADRVVAIHSGVPARARRRRRRAGGTLAGHDRYVLALGTIEPRKNLTTLVRAFDRVAESDPELGLVLAGPPGWDFARVQSAIDASRAARPHRADRASSTTATAPTSSRARPCSRTRRSTRASASRRSRRCSAACRWSPATRARCPRCSATPPSSCRRPTSTRSPTAIRALADPDDPSARRRYVAPRSRRAARYDWDTTAARMVDLYRSLA